MNACGAAGEPPERIAATPNIEILTGTEVTALEGRDGVLSAIRCRSHRAGEETQCRIRHLFLFIGAEPNTAWLAGSGVALPTRSSNEAAAD
jgi:thioredoxin reductase (NADPH)